MKALRAAPAIATLCRVLEVSPSGYYAWHRRPASLRAREDAALTAEIEAIHIHSRGTYGAPRIHAELVARGRRVSRKRVARLMRAAQLRGVSRRKFVVTTTRAADARPAPDLVRRAFTETGPNQLWVADITYIPTGRGFLYLAVVLDVWSRRIVGWAMETHLRTALVLAALDMAVEQRQPRAVIHHSDQGCQYTALAFGARCRQAGVRPSMGSVGDCYDSENEASRSGASFAALCGVSPLDASSGRQRRHRLNRGGNRNANRALWVIAFVRLRMDARTKVYAARRTEEGRSRSEITRCLKRYIVREVYRLLMDNGALRTCAEIAS